MEDAQSGDTICTSCGLVLQDRAFQLPPVHYGAPMEDVLVGQTITNCTRRLRHAAADSGRLRGLVASTCDLQAAAARINLPQAITDTASELWKQVLAHRTCKGAHRQGLAGACIYFSCKLVGFPRPKSAIADALFLPVTALARAIKVYLSMGLQHEAGTARPTESRDVLAAAVSIVAPAGQERRVLAKARVSDEEVTATGVLEGRTPRVRAAVAIIVALEQLALPAQSVHKELGICANTIQRSLATFRANCRRP